MTWVVIHIQDIQFIKERVEHDTPTVAWVAADNVMPAHHR